MKSILILALLLLNVSIPITQMVQEAIGLVPTSNFLFIKAFKIRMLTVLFGALRQSNGYEIFVLKSISLLLIPIT